MALRPFFLTDAQTKTEMTSWRRRLALLAAALPASFTGAQAADVPRPSVPMPAKMEMAAGKFVVSRATPVVCDGADKGAAFACDFVRRALARPFLELPPPPDMQHPIVFEHLSHSQASLALGISDGAVRTRLHRARTRIATVLSESEDESNINTSKEANR